MKKKIPKITMAFPSDGLVQSWLKNKPGQISGWHNYQQATHPTNKDPEWALSRMPDIAWDQYQYRMFNHAQWQNEPGIKAVSPEKALDFTNGFKPLHKLEQLICIAYNKNTYLSISKNIQEPISLNMVAQENDIVLEHLVIVVEKGVEVKIIDTLNTQAKNHLIGRSVNVIVKEGGRLSYVCEQNYEQSSFFFNYYSFFAHQQSIIEAGWFTAGEGYAKSSIDFFLLGREAQIRANMLSHVTGTGYNESMFRQNHYAPYSSSRLCAKGLAGEQSSLVFRAKVTIKEEANQSNADQQTSVLLLSGHARAITFPALEVKTNDVQCSHGSAIGKLNAQDIFYLQTRGLTDRQAKNVLIIAFIKQSFHEFEGIEVDKFLNGFTDRCGKR